jgi:hypothetical protein
VAIGVIRNPHARPGVMDRRPARSRRPRRIGDTSASTYDCSLALFLHYFNAHKNWAQLLVEDRSRVECASRSSLVTMSTSPSPSTVRRNRLRRARARCLAVRCSGRPYSNGIARCRPAGRPVLHQPGRWRRSQPSTPMVPRVEYPMPRMKLRRRSALTLRRRPRKWKLRYRRTR